METALHVRIFQLLRKQAVQTQHRLAFHLQVYQEALVRPLALLHHIRSITLQPRQGSLILAPQYLVLLLPLPTRSLGAAHHRPSRPSLVLLRQHLRKFTPTETRLFHSAPVQELYLPRPHTLHLQGVLVRQSHRQYQFHPRLRRPFRLVPIQAQILLLLPWQHQVLTLVSHRIQPQRL